MKYLSALAILLLFSACSFNHAFYQPEKLKPSLQSINFITPKDTVVLHFDGAAHIASFTNIKGAPVHSFAVETVNFKNSKGRQLYGWLLKPATTKQPKITLLFLHGNAGNIINQFQGAMPLVQRGFAVFIFDYSGYGFSEGRPTRKVMLSDAYSALQVLEAKEYAKKTKIIVYGQSIGGIIASALAAQHQDLIDALVLEGAPASHRQIAGEYFKPLKFLIPVLVKEGYSSVKSVAQFHKPILIIQSHDDQTIPFYMGHEIYEHANPPKTFYEISGPHINGPELFGDSIAYKIRNLIAK